MAYAHFGYDSERLPFSRSAQSMERFHNTWAWISGCRGSQASV